MTGAFAQGWRTLDAIEETNSMILLDWSILFAAIVGRVGHPLMNEPA